MLSPGIPGRKFLPRYSGVQPIYFRNSFLVSVSKNAPLYSEVIVLLLMSLIPLDETQR